MKIPNTRQNPCSDNNKILVASEVSQEPQGASDGTSDDEKTTQAREPSQEEETKREYDVEEKNDDEIDY